MALAAGLCQPPCGICKGRPLKRKRPTRHWVHRVFFNLKRWAKGVFHGIRERQLQRYLDKCVFRRHMRSGFGTLPGIGLSSSTFRDFVDQRV